MTHHTSKNPEMQRCIEACNRCHQICLQMAMMHCLKMGGKHVEQEHLRLMMNCAAICQTAADFMLSDSPLHSSVCAACAEVCMACVESCQKVGDMDECEEACRHCAETCEDMARPQGSHRTGSSMRQSTPAAPM